LIPRLTDYGFADSVFARFSKLTCKDASNPGERKFGMPMLYDTAWLAPELLEAYFPDAGHINLDFYAIDVYAYGIILYETVTRELPYPGVNSMAIGLLVLGEGIRPDVPDFVPDALVSHL
jgi:serine/threonine protein kinase